MGNRRRIQPGRLLAIAVAALILLTFAGAQSQKPAQKQTKPTKAQMRKAAADSVAAAQKADSIARAFVVLATADSIRRADSLARYEDSLNTRPFRKIRNDAFIVGERLVFNVNYGFITAGEAVMAVTGIDTVAGRECYRIEFTVNSLPSFSWIYRVEDVYRTFIDVEAIMPWRFEQHIREGTYRRDFIAEFDQRRNVARTTEGTYPIPDGVHDIMSAFYFARTIDFSGFVPGDGILLNNFYKDKTHELKVNFLGRQQLEVEGGTFNTLVVEPLVKEGGLFKSEGRIVIWLTDDERKIPVRVNTKVVIGSIDTELREYQGLAGPLRSRID